MTKRSLIALTTRRINSQTSKLLKVNPKWIQDQSTDQKLPTLPKRQDTALQDEVILVNRDFTVNVGVAAKPTTNRNSQETNEEYSKNSFNKQPKVLNVEDNSIKGRISSVN